MASSKLAARAMRNHAKYKGRNDLNIVPMIDMMVILVFFLLFTAVFSNTNILELNLPAPNSSVPELPKGLQLEVIVRQNVIEIADRNSGVLRSLPRKEGEYDYLANDQDREMLKWVRAFNRYDLYSKGDGRPDAKALRPYYEDLVNEFFPTPLQW